MALFDIVVEGTFGTTTFRARLPPRLLVKVVVVLERLGADVALEVSA
jgi:hypothetical protein